MKSSNASRLSILLLIVVFGFTAQAEDTLLKIPAGPTVFGGHNKFYIGAGASSVENQQYTLSRIELDRVNGAWNPNPKPLIPGADPNGTNIVGKKITHISLTPGSVPVIAVENDPTHVYMVGDAIVKNVLAINDKDVGGTPAQGIHALCATQIQSKPVVFTAVSNNASLPLATTQSVALLQQDADTIKQVKTAGISLDATVGAGGFAYNHNAAWDNGATTDLWWDGYLQRLYIALAGVKTGNTVGDAAVALGIGKFTSVDVASFSLSPIVNPDFFKHDNANNKTQGNKTFVIGATSAGAPAEIIDLFKVRTMHTSTGKDYVILNGGARNFQILNQDDAGAWVCALPIFPAGDVHAGELARIDALGILNPITKATELLSVDRGLPVGLESAIVGAYPSYLTSMASIITLGENKIVEVGNKIGPNTLGGGSELLKDSQLKRACNLNFGTTIGGSTELAGGDNTSIPAVTKFGSMTKLSPGVTLPRGMSVGLGTSICGPVDFEFNLTEKTQALEADSQAFIIIPAKTSLLTIWLLGGLTIARKSVLCGTLCLMGADVTVNMGVGSTFILPAGTKLDKGTVLKVGSIVKNDSADDFSLVDGKTNRPVVFPKRSLAQITAVDLTIKEDATVLPAQVSVGVASHSEFVNVALPDSADINVSQGAHAYLQVTTGSIFKTGSKLEGRLGAVSIVSDVTLNHALVYNTEVTIGKASLGAGIALAIPTGKKITFKGDTTWGGGIFNPDSEVTLGGRMILAAGSTISQGSTIAKDSIIRDDKVVNSVKITDMQVVGDTVYISLAEDRKADPSADAGVFASTVLLDKKGFIKDWTPWQRVSWPDAVSGFGFDEQSNNVWYTTTSDGTQDQPASKQYTKAKVMTWGPREKYEVLNSEFTQNNLGMTNIVNFDDETVGFKQSVKNDEWPYFSMMVAAGYGQVALVQTGTRDVGGIFQPTSIFTRDANVFIFDEKNDASKDVLPKLGFISCAELSRMQEADSGWLFVGGTGGVAVLRKSDGTGFTNLQGFKHATDGNNFPDSGTWKFVQLVDAQGKSPFTEIRKLVAVGVGSGIRGLYILTRTNLYCLEMTKEQFKTGQVTTLQEVTSIDRLTAAKSCTYEDEFCDLLILKRALTVDATSNTSESTTSLLLATSSGLLKNRTADNVLFDPIGDLGPSLRFDFVSSQRFGKFIDLNNNSDYVMSGNLYVTAFEPDPDGSKQDTSVRLCVYRFNVNGDTVEPIVEQYKDGSGNPTTYFYSLGTVNISAFETNGQIDFMALSRHVGKLFVEKISTLPVSSYFKQTGAIDLNQSVYGAHLGTVVRDTASGSLCAISENGLSVNSV